MDAFLFFLFYFLCVPSEMGVSLTVPYCPWRPPSPLLSLTVPVPYCPPSLRRSLEGRARAALEQGGGGQKVLKNGDTILTMGKTFAHPRGQI